MLFLWVLGPVHLQLLFGQLLNSLHAANAMIPRILEHLGTPHPSLPLPLIGVNFPLDETGE